jgi:DNA polymerase I-like protein with 3'-5' exonuclease and polymerase domains
VGGKVRLVAVDTEWEKKGTWSVQWAEHVGDAWIWLVEMGGECPVKELLESPDTLTVMHNALADLPRLLGLGICPSHFTDTMIMAYLVGTDGIGLKTLAYRLAGMVMDDYEDVVRPATEAKTRGYMEQVLEREWADPEPEIEIRPDGSQHVKWGQNIRRRLGAYMKKLEKGTATLTPYQYWNHKDRQADREMVEPVLGELEPGYLSEIPWEDAREYMGADPDATLRIYPRLRDMVKELGLEDALERDLGCVEMVVDMMDNGMLLDMLWFEELEKEFRGKREKFLEDIEAMAGQYVNPNSHLQVRAALKRKGVEIEDTSSDTLDRLRYIPLVKGIQDYRGIDKLLGTYVTKMPRMVY